MEEYLSPWIIWLIIAAALIIVELLTNTFAAFCLVGGCLIALIASLAGLGITAQLIGAAIGTVAAFIALLPLIRKMREKRKSRNTGSNMDALIGRVAILDQPILPGQPGRLSIDGTSWQAAANGNSKIPAGEKVRVTGYDSIVLEVESLQAEA